MRKLCLIVGLFLWASVSYGGKVVVLEVVKDGNGWQNFFNCYARVTTTYQGCENDVTYASLNCQGAGYNWCRASREIGARACSSGSGNILQMPAIVDAINALIVTSEKSAERGVLRGGSSQKVALTQNGVTQLYFVKATWQYNQSAKSNSTLRIVIETNDKPLGLGSSL